jgi:hypothetical protein
MRICSVEGCQNNSSSENVSFFSFPNTEEDRAKWIKFTKKQLERAGLPFGDHGISSHPND